MKFLLGKKQHMSQLFTEEGAVPVTVIQAGPAIVTQLKQAERDGYDAVQIGYGSRKAKNVSRAVQGHTKHAIETAGKDPATENFRWIREAQLDPSQHTVGEVLDVTGFEVGDTVTVCGTTKGKGFQGGMKKHNFHGAKEKTHGTKHSTREIGSIGATGPQRVFKGRKMPGRMGSNRVTTKGLEVAGIDSKQNLLYVKGSVPGANGGLIEISAA